MSGNPTGSPTGSNVVPMPHAAAPAPTQASAPMPFPMWGGGGSLPWGPGCCPPGGMDALMKCYCDVQAATAFICSVMVQCINTNPAVTAAIIAAIEASGSSLPLIGVTNGSNAQPGQVGEFVTFQATVNIPTTAQTITTTLGVLQPGDWDCDAYIDCANTVGIISAELNPVPAGFSNPMVSELFGNTNAEAAYLTLPSARGSFAVPTLIAMRTTTNDAVPGTNATYGVINFSARRAR